MLHLSRCSTTGTTIKERTGQAGAAARPKKTGPDRRSSRGRTQPEGRRVYESDRRHIATAITTRKKIALKTRKGVRDAPAAMPTTIAPRPTSKEQNRRSAIRVFNKERIERARRPAEERGRSPARLAQSIERSRQHADRLIGPSLCHLLGPSNQLVTQRSAVFDDRFKRRFLAPLNFFCDSLSRLE